MPTFSSGMPGQLTKATSCGPQAATTAAATIAIANVSADNPSETRRRSSTWRSATSPGISLAASKASGGKAIKTPMLSVIRLTPGGCEKEFTGTLNRDMYVGNLNSHDFSSNFPMSLELDWPKMPRKILTFAIR
jgi:hypothetical protein